MRPLLLDLFCGAGGASAGYERAGFQVVGLDIVDQPNYPFTFVQADALTFPLDGFDVIHASPPCQHYSTLRTTLSRQIPRGIIPVLRQRLIEADVPYVIENVIGAPLVDPVRVCGTSLECVDVDAELRRHRLFESNVDLLGTPCRHRLRSLGIYGHLTIHDRPNRPLDGDGSHHGWKAGKARARRLMGIDWPITDAELGEAIPPAYTEYIGHQVAVALERAA